MSKEQKNNVTILNEGSTRTNGVKDKPSTAKPNVKPSGQQTSQTKDGSIKKAK